jgi:hypothetical protein
MFRYFNGQSVKDWPLKRGLLFYESMKFALQVIEVKQEFIQFFLDVMMWNAVPESGMFLCFKNMIPDLVFQIMDIDKLNMELVVKMFNAQ